MIEVEIVGVRIELPSNQPLVLLREIHGERHVPIWIGTPEAPLPSRGWCLRAR
jgi:bifunctional DNase/RNase